MSRTRGHRKCARAKCGVCSGMVGVRVREIKPRMAALAQEEQESDDGASWWDDADDDASATLGAWTE